MSDAHAFYLGIERSGNVVSITINRPLREHSDLRLPDGVPADIRGVGAESETPAGVQPAPDDDGVL
jgi:hypothetical protein